jgi:chromosome segregation ATPase
MQIRRRSASASNPTENPWMSFHQFLEDVSCELQEILWMDGPRRSREFHRLEAELRRASTALFRLRSSVDELRRRLAEKEPRAQWLKARVEVYLHVADQVNAWRYALELDQFQRTLDHERTRLRRRQEAYQAHLARLQHLQAELDGLTLAMYSRG